MRKMTYRSNIGYIPPDPKKLQRHQPYQSQQYPPQNYQEPQQYDQEYPQYDDAYQQEEYLRPARDKVLLVSAIFSLAWFVFVCINFASLMNGTPSGSDAEQLGYEIGATIGLMLQIPFLITSFLGTVFNWLSWLLSKRGFAITAGVLFSVSVFLSIGNGFGYILSLVLCFIGASRLKKRMI